MGDEPAPGSGDATAEEDPRVVEFRNRYKASELRLSRLFSAESSLDASRPDDGHADDAHPPAADIAKPAEQPKKPARVIDEDDYGDDDEDEDDQPDNQSPLQLKAGAGAAAQARPSPQSINLTLSSKPPPLDLKGGSTSNEQAKNSEETRKKLQEDKQAAEEEAKRHFNTLFYTLENDRIAMLEQQKLDELDRQVDAEISGEQGSGSAGAAGAASQQGSLSTANLGASSLMLKHLLARVDAKRSLVKAQDSQLRRLISEVRKNRSKWASEDKIGQEELYEAAERVLQELKAMTEHSAPFLQKVNKRDAPDYYSIIKQPMDIGTMQKKLKALQYKSKKEFVDDLHLIWNNCLKYNSDPNHPLRKKALIMQKQTDKLVVLIPDVVVRDRAEVEAEERRMQSLDADLDGIEDSEDEEPIMASRGRKAPTKKGKKGGSATRKAPHPDHEDSSTLELKPQLPSLGSSSNLRNNFLRADSDAPMENGFSTPPPGTLTPLGPNGVLHSGAPPSQADASDAEAGNSVNELVAEPAEDPDADDWEYRFWKHTTKKARAMAAAERHRLFRGDKINPEEPALLRNKAGMRRWMRQQRLLLPQEEQTPTLTEEEANKDSSKALQGETLAEGMEEEDDDYLPEYYDPVSAIPDLDPLLKWEEDADGQVVNHAEECLRIVPREFFSSPESALAKRMYGNMRQMQDTRKVTAKIGIVKQMQLQSQVLILPYSLTYSRLHAIIQMYQNQFQKYDPLPFIDADVDTVVISDEGPVMAPWVCRAALQRSVGKIFYHAGFEEFQPSALEAVTDVAINFFNRLVASLKEYKETPKVANTPNAIKDGKTPYIPRYSFEETVLHTLDSNGVDLDALDSYVTEDVERLGSKLGVMHERMKTHLAELLRPALDPGAGADGAGAFNDGSEQFVSGDFAEDVDEDFFGFKELGLDKELGLSSLSVPFHLLQNRMHNAYQSQNTAVSVGSGVVMEMPAPFEPVTVDSIKNEIGVVQEWFLAKLAANNDQPLIEDETLPVKHQKPKPRLPTSGKITSPMKRPPREQLQMAKKRRKLEEGRALEINHIIAEPTKKLKLDVPREAQPVGEPEKEDDEATGMPSPESM